MDKKQMVAETIVTPELYFLISKFLTAGPLQETAKVLVRELEDKKVLPKRTDWLGVEHDQTFAELDQKYAHIGPSHLLDICCRIVPILDKDLAPSVPGLVSLLGNGRQSLLRTQESIYRPRSLLDYCTRVHGVSLADSSVTVPIHNFQKVLTGREYGGPVRRKLLVPTSLYGKTKLLRRTVGHLSSVYCVLFDRTGRYIITGADDLLIKIWSSLDGRLLATLRGASAEITDIAINLDNTMLAAGSLDRILRVWDMQTTSPIAVLAGHTGMITSVNFCPSPRSDLKYLVTTSTDGSIAFWQYSTPRGQKITFAPKPTQYHEKLRPGQAQMMCTTYSPGGMFLAAGSADHHVRVYIMSEDGPKRILETEAYTDAVDSVQWSHRGLRFISGSKDGTAHIWTFESQQWKSVKLCMSERLPTCPEPEEGKKLKVTMVAWDCSDKYVITAANDFTIKIWHSRTAKLHHVLRGHKDELYVLESNPKDEHVLLSAGHDGQVFLWDIERGISVAHFVNNIDGQGHGGVFDAKWSPDGTMIAATDSHGHILIFGLGIGPDKYKILPTELFFHTDYRPLLRDGSHHVVDEQTQIMPHLMAPPFLVDADGNPHPAKYQRYVPGLEICSMEQLVPNIATNGANGTDENMPASTNYSHIDRLIAALAYRQGGPGSSGSAAAANNQSNPNHSQIDRLIVALANRQEPAPDSNNRQSANGNFLGTRPTASRNANDNQQRRGSDASNTPRQGTTWGQPPATEQQLQPTQFKYIRRIYVRPMKYAQLQNLKQTVYAAGQFEMQEYKREMRRRPIMINTASSLNSSQAGAGRQRNSRTNGGGAPTARRRAGGRAGAQSGAQVQQPAPAYRTRAVRDQEELDEPEPAQEDDDDDGSNSGDTSFSNVEENLEENSEDSDTDSSDYSDWVADTPGPNLEPPKRSKRKPLSRRRTFSGDSSDESNEQATTSAGAAAKATQRKKRVEIPPAASNGEIPDLFRPAEWLSEVIPRKAPYYPQMGDEVVYFRQGHQRYLEAVRTKKVYKLSHSSEPWNFRTLRDHELVRIIGIKYEIRPPRLCCLKLAMIDVDGNMTGTSFKIKYHDMPDVLDFLVLRQTFDLAVQRNWSISDRFRCMIGDGWWMGQIESRHLLSADFPDSYFMCFRVRWDNGEYEYMSPWDMEPIDEQRLPDQIGGAVPVLPEEIRATLYQPKSEEWHRGDRDGSCRRIVNGLEQVMSLSIAEHFLAPVDLNIYPDYAYLIEYPIDLTTVKSRFENHFYRRITTAQFDVRYLATNAEKYNRSHTNIVKHARIITDLCLRIIREPNDIDVAAIYHQLVDVYHSSESENDNESDVVPSTSTGPSTSAAARQNMTAATTRRSKRIRSDGDWRTDCRQLLDLMWLRPDSVPFREPVDTIEFPDYLEIISTPMDLRTVKEDLLGGNYDDPLDFAKDVRLIFQNSKNYNTNKRSRIYSMTLRLSALFESRIKKVVSNWKARRRADKSKADSARGSSSSPSKRNTTNGRAGPSTRKNQKVTRRLRQSSDDDDDDDDDEEVDSRPRGTQRRGHVASVVTVVGGGGIGAAPAGRNGITRSAAVASSSSLNRVTSSSSHRQAATDEAAAVPTRSTRRMAASQEIEDNDDEDEDVHVTDEDNTSSASSDDDNSSEDATSDNASDSHHDDDDDSHNTRHRKRARRPIRHKKHSGAEDSEDSYKPDASRRKAGAKTKKSNRKNKQKAKRKCRGEDHDEDDDDDYTATTSRKNNSVNNRRGGTTKPAATQRNRVQQQRRAFRTSEEDTIIPNAAVLHGEESTQDTVVSHTPKKKGRPPKVRSSPNAVAFNGTSEPCTSANALRRGGRRNAAENDHSYHLPMRNGRIAESDNDSREVAARPTRSSVKRAILDWARSSDVEERTETDSEEAEEILPTPTPTKVNGVARSNVETNGPSSSRAVANVTRQLRTNRNTVVERTDEENTDDVDGGSDNEPLASSQNSQQRSRTNYPPPLKTSTPHPLQLQRRQLHTIGSNNTAALHMTRSHATTITTSVATSSSNSRAASAGHDHDYMGDAGPSTSSAALRNSRRVLSRHQRNADELDCLESSLDPLENTRLIAPRILEISSRLRRGTPTSTSSGTVVASASARRQREEASSAVTVRRGRSRYSQENSQPSANTEKDETDDDDDEGDDDAGGSDEGTNGGSSSQSDDGSDSEDNQPLTSYVPTAAAAPRRTRNHAKSSRKTNRKRRHRRNGGGTDDSFDDADAYDRRQRHKNVQTRKNRRQRDSRNLKRPRYNEQSDEEEQDYGSGRKRRRNGNIEAGVVSSNQQQQQQQQQQPPPPLNVASKPPPPAHNEDDDSTDSESDDEQLVSVSSRGRVRKITAKARGIFKE